MKKIFLIWAVLVLAAPAMAVDVVDVCAVPIVGSDLVEIRYRVVSGQLPRAFALDITVTDGNIADVTGFFRGGECDDVNRGYGIFPASFARYINADFNNWDDANYTPVADACDLPGDTQPGLVPGSNGVTIEMGSLYEDGNEPPNEGVLCIIQITEDCTINLAANVGRGKVVLEDGTPKDPCFHPGQGLLLDWGDAPDPTFPTLKLSAPSGARHIITKMPGLHLGLNVDPEADGQPNATATGDDIAGVNDDDGVVFTSLIDRGQIANVNVTTSMAGGLLDAWVDFNRNGVWEHPGEQIFANAVLNTVLPGVNSLTFNVPAGADLGETFARFRYSDTGNLKPWHEGVRPNGEVEDYMVEITERVCHVPDVVGWTSALAQTELIAHGFTIGTITTECSDTIAEGNVISTDPPYCEYPGCGTPVDIVVSTGPCALCPGDVTATVMGVEIGPPPGFIKTFASSRWTGPDGKTDLIDLQAMVYLLVWTGTDYVVTSIPAEAAACDVTGTVMGVEIGPPPDFIKTFSQSRWTGPDGKIDLIDLQAMVYLLVWDGTDYVYTCP